MFLKICGITSERDAQTAVRYGASAIGLVFCSSPRRVSPRQALCIRRSMPSSIEVVGVFLDEEVSRVRETADFCGLDAVQLHGNEPPEVCRAVDLPVIKAFRVRDQVSLSLINDYRGAVRAVLLDSWSPDVGGGTGRRFDWSLVAGARAFDVPMILAGGLTPDNVASAVAGVGPWGLDVSSGVERSPGEKDPVLVRRFLERALACVER